MDIKETSRGFAHAEFVDACGRRCSMQDSSLASEAAIWLGVDTDEKGVSQTTRMHLTQKMAAALHGEMVAHLAGKEIMAPERKDLYGNLYMVTSQVDILEVGIVTTREGEAGVTMLLERDDIEDVLAHIAGFADMGSIAMEAREGWNDPKPEVVLDVKVPASMLARADLAETGTSAQAVIDALCEMMEVQTAEELASMLGHDRAQRILAVHDKVRPHWRNEDGTYAIQR